MTKDYRAMNLFSIASWGEHFKYTLLIARIIKLPLTHPKFSNEIDVVNMKKMIGKVWKGRGSLPIVLWNVYKNSFYIDYIC
jgi:hypothetical protein